MEDQGKPQEFSWAVLASLPASLWGGIQRQLVAKRLAELAIPTTDHDCISHLRKRHRCLVWVAYTKVNALQSKPTKNSHLCCIWTHSIAFYFISFSTVEWNSILRLCVLSSSVVSDALWLHGTVVRQASLFMGILQTGIVEWFAMPSSWRSSQPRDWTQSPALQVDSLPSEPPGKPHCKAKCRQI